MNLSDLQKNFPPTSPTATVRSSTASAETFPSPLSTPSHELVKYSVTVAAPEVIRTEDPVFYTLTVHNNLRGTSWTVQRRFSQFDELNHILWWQRAGIDPELFPPKLPPPGHDVFKLRIRAAALEAWASQVLRVASLGLPALVAFFQLDPPRDGCATTDEEVREAEAAIVRLQAMGRGYSARSLTASPARRRAERTRTSAPQPRARTTRVCGGFVALLCASLLLPVLMLGGSLQCSPHNSHSVAAAIAPFTPPLPARLARLTSCQASTPAPTTTPAVSPSRSASRSPSHSPSKAPLARAVRGAKRVGAAVLRRVRRTRGALGRFHLGFHARASATFEPAAAFAV